jgi:hypothetical protein
VGVKASVVRPTRDKCKDWTRLETRREAILENGQRTLGRDGRRRSSEIVRYKLEWINNTVYYIGQETRLQ